MSKNKFRFGVTNIGDASLDLEWASYLDNVIGANISARSMNLQFIDLLLKHKSKVIFMPIVSGLGGTALEVGIPTYQEMFKLIKKLVYLGFPEKQIVLKIYPILPIEFAKKINSILNIDYLQNLKNILSLAKELEIKRVKLNYLRSDTKMISNLYNFNNSLKFDECYMFDPNKEISLEMMNNSFEYETDDFFYPYAEHLLTVSNKDLNILGLAFDYKFNKENTVTNYVELTLSHESNFNCILSDF